MIIYFGVNVEYKKIIDENNVDVITRFYTSHKQNILNLNNLDFSSQLTELNGKIHEEELKGSGFFF